MKLSETPETVRRLRQDYITSRWTQLSESTQSYGEEAIKYLLVVNTAAMGATLGFFGAMAHLRPLLWPKIALLLFAFGVAILGFYHPIRYHRIDWIFRSWRRDVKRYSADEIDWNTLIDDDEKRTRKLGWLQILCAYLSLFAFFAGVIVAAANFQDVAVPSGGKDDRPQATNNAASPEAAGAKPAPKSDQNAGPRPGNKGSP